MDSTFSQLLEGLNVGMVILVDDDFMFAPDAAERIVSELVCMQSKDIHHLLKQLDTLGFKETGQIILKFIDNFNKLPKSEIHLPSLTQIKRIFHYLDKVSSDEVINVKEEATNLMNYLIEQFSANGELRNLFLEYGVGLMPVANYSRIIQSSKGIPIRIYKEKPSVDIIKQQIDDNLSPLQYCIFIVDKLLGDDDGVRFVKEELVEVSKNRNLISVVYTSQPTQAEEGKKTDLFNLHDYFVFEVGKGQNDSIRQLTEGLAFCAFVGLFYHLSRVHMRSIDEAMTLAMSRKDNMIYLASMAHDEGITPYEAVSKWFQIASQFQMIEALMEQGVASSVYNFLSGLTEFLQEDYLGTGVGFEIEEEADIQKLNTFEIFDYSVNIKHQPPAPGDVFLMDDGKYYILVGQDCDLIVRGNQTSRNARYAEMLPADYLGKQNLDKIQKGSNSLEFNYFRKLNNDVSTLGVLSVKLEKTLTSDFIGLDLCAFNSDGSSLLELNKELNGSIKRVLPLSWRNYYAKIMSTLEQHKKHLELCIANNIDINLFKTTEISVVDFNTDGDKISYPIRRICRLKHEFRDILLSSYWEYRRRTGINTIGLVNKEKLPFVKIQVGYPGQEHEIITSVNIQTYIGKSNSRNRNRDFNKISLYLEIDNLKEIIPHLSGFTENVIEIEKRAFMHIETQTLFKKNVLENKLEAVIITLPYTLEHNGEYIQKDKFTLTDLLSKEQKSLIKGRASSLVYAYEDDLTQTFDLFKGTRSVEFDVDDLKRGIIINEVNLKISLYGDVIQVSSIVENALVGA